MEILTHEKKLNAGFKAALGYVRVSTEEQAKDDRYGREAQRQAILKWAMQNRYVIVGWEEDIMSGTSDERPGLLNLMFFDYKKDNVEAVICFKSDRIARDTKLYFYYLYQFEKRGVELFSTIEDFGQETDLANVYRALMLFVAEQERKNIIMRTQMGKEVKREKGGWCGGRVPFGYRVISHNLEVDDYESFVVRYIFHRMEQGSNPYKIAIELNSRKFTTRRGGDFKNTNIMSIIKNEMFYKGFVKNNEGEWVAGSHPKILLTDREKLEQEYEKDEETFKYEKTKADLRRERAEKVAERIEKQEIAARTFAKQMEELKNFQVDVEIEVSTND